MPRQPRLDIPGVVHHVMARGIEGGKIFRCDEDRYGFLRRLGAEINQSGGPRLYAWVLMDNHFHLLLRPGKGLLSPVMRRIMTGHAVACNMRHNRKGHLFQNRYKSILVEEEPYFLELVRYIHLNPLRAGIVKTVDELGLHPFAGHSVIMGNRTLDGQDVDAVLARFSANKALAVKSYGEFVSAGANQGRRPEFQGGGLVRSAGGVSALACRAPEEREQFDARILGSGGFVESVLQGHERSGRIEGRAVDAILHDIAAESGIDARVIVGPSRGRDVSSVRRQFYLRAYEAGATYAALGKLTGRSHTSVREAIMLAKREEEGGE